MAEAAVGLEPGTILVDKYRVERVLGKGGMGVVVLATHTELEDRFAIKILIGELDADAQQRFLREARAAAQIKSDHIARVVDVGTLPEGVPYMVMEFLEGSDLAGLIDQRGAMPVPEAIDLMLQACIGLTEAHVRGFVHRDLKPANLFVQTTSDGRQVIKVLDFGISKATRDVSLTSTRAVLGTPAYMAPEQWRSAKDADIRADIWSLGVVLHELLSGNRPFQGDTVPEMCAAVLAEDPPPLKLGLPALEKVVARCLEKEPEKRYQRVPELARDLAPFATDPEAANALVDRMDRVAGRPSSPSLPRASTAPTAVDRPTAPAPVALAETLAAPAAPRSKRTLALAIGAAAVIAAGTTYALTRSSDPAPTATVKVPSTPQRGGTLRVAMNRDDETRVALYAGQPTRTQAALRMVMERIVIIDELGKLQRSVLQSVAPSDDDKTLVLTLRPDIRFHDSKCLPSAAATGKDLEFSITEAIALHQLDFDIASMTASDLALTIKLKSPVVSYAHALSHVWLIPAKLVDCEPDRMNLQHPIGTGPFRWIDAQVPSLKALARWDGYWRTDATGKPLPYLDRIELVQVGEASAALARLHEDASSPRALHVFIPTEPLRARLIDASGITPKLIGEATAGLELGTRTNEPDVGLWLLEFPKPGPLRDDVNLRRAISFAIDREAAVKVGTRGAAAPVAPSYRFLQSSVLGYDRKLVPLRKDAAEATRLLAGNKLAFTLGYSHNRRAAEEIVKSLAMVGITATLEEIDLRDQSAVLAGGDAGVDAMLVSRWGKKLGNELISISAFDQQRTKAIKDLLIELASKSSTTDREQGYQKLERALLDQLPSIPIATLDPKRITFATIVRPGVEGFHDRATGFVPHDDALTFAETWLAASPGPPEGVGSANQSP